MSGKFPLFSIDVKKINLGDVYINVNFKADLNEGVFQVSGRNGSGKTSLLKAIVGCYSFLGECILGGERLDKDHRAYKNKLGYCPDRYDFTENISCREYIRFISHARYSYPVYSKEKSACSEKNLLEEANTVGLTPFLDSTIKTLSYGNKKKLLLITSLAKDPLAWILDEPLNGLDSEGLKWLADKLERKSTSSCILIVSHDSEWLNRFNPSVRKIA